MFKKNYKPALRKAIIEAIDFEGHTTDDGRPFAPKTDDDKILLLVNIARDEAGHEMSRKGLQPGLEYWLSGLPSCIHLPVYCGEILEFAVKIGSVVNPTEKETDKICENFYRFMAANILKLYAKAVNRLEKSA